MKSKAAPRGRILKVSVDKNSGVPLASQIYRALREAMTTGRLPAGQAIPSTRVMASDLGVSRSTVVLALEQLRSEGYLSTRQGARTRVNRTLPESSLVAQAAAAVARVPGPTRLSMRAVSAATRTGAVTHIFHARGARPFRLGVPAFDLFPMEVWGRTVSSVWRSTSPRSLGYSDARGFPPLRALIAEYISAARGVHCSPDQILVTGGSQHAIGIAALALMDPGDKVLMEDPGYFGAAASFTLHGAQVVPVPIDSGGMRISEAKVRAPDARVAFVMPTRNVYLGTSMSAERRREMLAWAGQADGYIIEDDYGAEFQFSGRPFPALQSEDSSGRVLYIGSFSKIMFPSLRLGFMVVPDGLVDAFGAVRYVTDMQSPYLEQAAMAAFLEAGHYERHVRRMRQTYLERQDLLVDHAERHLRGWLRVPAVEGGMTVVGWLPEGVSDHLVAQEAMKDGIEIAPVSRFVMENPYPPALLLGFSGVSDKEIQDGIHALARTFERLESAGILRRDGRNG